jgi:hypothetical protein
MCFSADLKSFKYGPQLDTLAWSASCYGLGMHPHKVSARNCEYWIVSEAKLFVGELIRRLRHVNQSPFEAQHTRDALGLLALLLTCAVSAASYVMKKGIEVKQLVAYRIQLIVWCCRWRMNAVYK